MVMLTLLKKDTPEYIVDVIASVMKALCVKIDAGEEETDRCIQKVKERKMGYLFENMEKMSIREERRLRAEAEQRADEAEKHLEEAEKRAEEVEKQAEQRVKEAEKRAAEAEKRAREALEELERKKRKQC